MSGEIDLNPSGEVAYLLPILQRLEHRLAHIGQRVEDVIPRRPIPESVKQRHREAIKALGGRCPCCGIMDILDTLGEVIGAEYDHFYSRERNALEDTWLICRTCHLGMKDRARFTDQFRVYQQRVVAVEWGQLTLI